MHIRPPLALIGGLMAISASPSPASAQPDATDVLTSDCAGGIAAHINNRSVLSRDGHARYAQRDWKGSERADTVRTGRIPADVAAALFDRLDAVRFETFSPPARPPIPDGVTCSLERRRGNVTHRVSLNAPMLRPGTSETEASRHARAREMEIRTVMSEMHRLVREAAPDKLD